MPNIAEQCRSIETSIAETIRRDTVGAHKPSGFRASELGHMCARAQYHTRVDWDKRPVPDDKLAAIFALGRELESYVERVLSSAGVRVVQTQVSIYDNRLDLSGRIDGLIVSDGKEIPIEIKSVNDRDFQRLNTWKDFCDTSSPWLLKWALQLPCYLWLHSAEHGIYVLVSKSTGEIKLVPVSLEESVELLDTAFKILDEAKAAMESGVPPEPKPWNRSLCRYCWCREAGLCPGVEESLASDVALEELAQYAEECAQLYEAYQRYNRAHKALSEGLKALPVAPGENRELFIGTVPVRISCYETTTYEIPKDIKDQYARTVERRKVELLGMER